MSAKADKPIFAIDSVETELQQIPFSAIKLDADSYAFRDAEDLNPEALKSLAEDIAVHGLTTPLLVKQLGEGSYLGLDCHRRHGAITANIEQGVAGFTADMLVPALVIGEGASELAIVSRAVAANVNRQAYSAEGRVRVAVRLKRLGMPEAEIARILGVGESTVARDLAVGSDDEMMDHIRAHRITATNAATLMKAAQDANRVDDLKAALAGWLEEVQVDIRVEDQRRAANDEDPLTGAEKWPQRYLTPGQVKAWRTSLEAGKPLGPAEFRYKAIVRREKGLAKIEIDRFSKFAHEMTATEMAKLYTRMADLTDDLQDVLLEKHNAEERERSSCDGSEPQPRGRQRLRAMGLQDLAAELGDENGDEAHQALLEATAAGGAEPE